MLALQANYDMETPVGLWFRHAQVALNARYPQTAIGSVTRYLQEAGREGEHYRAALALLDEAQSQVEGVETPAQTPVATPAQTPARTPQGPGSRACRRVDRNRIRPVWWTAHRALFPGSA